MPLAVLVSEGKHRKNIARFPSEMNKVVKITLELFDNFQRESENMTVQIKSGGIGDNSPYIV